MNVRHTSIIILCNTLKVRGLRHKIEDEVATTHRTYEYTETTMRKHTTLIIKLGSRY
jgi:hypothetical protein